MSSKSRRSAMGHKTGGAFGGGSAPKGCKESNKARRESKQRLFLQQRKLDSLHASMFRLGGKKQ